MAMTTCRKCGGEVERKAKNAHIVIQRDLVNDGGM